MKLSAYRYRFPLARPFITGGLSYSEREGLIFVMEAEGIIAYGEAAPLPGFSVETFQDVLQEFQQKREQIIACLEETVNNGPPLDEAPLRTLSPALAFAIDTLRCDYRAQKEQVTLRELLFDKPMDAVPLNATLGLDSPESTLESAEQYWDKGFRTFKLKTGGNFDRERESIARIRAAYPASRIRIDANRSWTPEEARANLGRLESLDIEYCEEPLQNPDVDRLLELKESVAVSIALDESLHQNESPEVLLERNAGSVIILKPMVFGSLERLFETYRLAVAHDYTPVFTTSLESGIGRMMTANLASGLGSPRLAHGLATGSLFKMDVWHDRAYIDNGHFVLPDNPGLGKERRPGFQELALEPIGY